MTRGPIDSDVDLDRDPPDEPADGDASRSPASARRLAVLAAIALGGGLGSVARYLVESAMPVHAGRFPWATFAVNLGGSFALGVLMVFVLEIWPPRRYARPFAGVGILGGFTTFSTFAGELRGLAGRGAWALADAYALSSLVGGVGAVACGIALTRTLGRRRRRSNAPVTALPAAEEGTR